jgi:hypothetical protein
MFKTAFQRGNRLFSLAVIGLGVLMLCAVGQFAAVMFKTYQAEREWNAMRRDFQEQWAAWRSQNIQTYSVTYSNCNYYLTLRTKALKIG